MKFGIHITLLSFGVLCLASCNDEYQAPTASKIKAAMAEMDSSRTIDRISNLNCKDLDKGKFFCRYEISYIGDLPEEVEKCIFSAASEMTFRPNSSCY